MNTRDYKSSRTRWLGIYVCRDVDFIASPNPRRILF